MSTEDTTSKNIGLKSSVRRFLNRLAIVFFISLLIPFFISLILQIPFVQKKAIDTITNHISEKTDFNVSIGSLNLSFVRGFTLRSFLVENEKDTILHSRALDIKLSKNLLYVLKNELHINNLSLFDADINIITKLDSTKSDFSVFLSRLYTSDQGDEDAKGKPIKLVLKNIQLQQVSLNIENQNVASSVRLKFENCSSSLGLLDFEAETFDVKTFIFYKPHLRIVKGIQPARNGEDRSQGNSSNKSVADFVVPSIQIGQLKILDGSIEVLSPTPPRYSFPHFDINNLGLKNLNLDISALLLNSNLTLSADLNNLSFETSDGFELSKASSKDIYISETSIWLPNFNLETPSSKLGNFVRLEYDSYQSFQHFAEDVNINFDWSGTKVSINDLAYFIPSIKNTEFFEKNSNKSVMVNGKFTGRVVNFRGEDVSLNFEKMLDLQGSFRLRNILNKDLTFLSMRLNSLNTEIRSLQTILPFINIPNNFFKLGKIGFKGSFDGFLNDFVAYGTLDTELGKAILDMKLDVKNGNDKASYSGSLALDKFDLGKWTNNQALGLISFSSKVSSGFGLDLSTARAKLIADVNLFQYKNYSYDHIYLNGELEKNRFTGNFISTDKNADFVFDGIIDMSGPNYLYDFQTTINAIDLQKLNILDYPFKVKARMNIIGAGNGLENLVGNVSADSISIVKRDSFYAINNLEIKSHNTNNGQKRLSIEADGTNLLISGNYNFATIFPDLKRILKLNFPHHTRNWPEPNTTSLSSNKFKFDLNLDRETNILSLLGLEDIYPGDFRAKGNFDGEEQLLDLVATTGILKIKDNYLFDLGISLSSKGNQADLYIHIDSSKISGREFKSFDFGAKIKGDTSSLNIELPGLSRSSDIIAIQLNLAPHQKGYALNIKNSNLLIGGRRWKFNADNEIVLGTKYLNIKNLVITDGNRFVELKDYKTEGLELKINKFDLAFINEIINYDKMYFAGEINGIMRVSDIFEDNPDIITVLSMDDFTINNESFGELNLDISKPKAKPLDVIFSLNKGKGANVLKLDASYNLDTKQVAASVKGRDFSLKFLEFILVGGISAVEAYVDLDARVSGPVDDMKLDGIGYLKKGKVKVNYLGETYRFDNQKVVITDKIIDLTGVRFTDSQGNTASISGGLKHKMFGDFELQATLSGDNVILVNTSKIDNPIYYGLGKGKVFVDFSGPVDSPRLFIDATSGQGTRLFIPIKESEADLNKSVINFVNIEEYLEKRKSGKAAIPIKLKGMEVEMNLNLTPDAEVSLIFDEAKGDIMKGRGRGNLKMLATRSGDFDMFGQYQIESGQYLFTAGPVIAKPFVIRRGGTIIWNGDPINAILNVDADYQVRTPLSLFLVEYLVNAPPELTNAARNRVDVKLSLNLRGTLYSPEVNFDIEFPELAGQLRSYAENKLRMLRTNPVEFNSQVFGLIVFNSFVPSTSLSDAVATNLGTAGISTISEFVSSQLSLFVTSVINEALEEDGLISGVDFDINLRNNNSLFGVSDEASILPSEIEIRFRNRFRFWDERLSVGVASNYVRESLVGLQNYLIPEFNIEYALTADRKLNLRIYGKYDMDDINVTTRRETYGFALRFRTEFGPMMETRSSIKKALRDAIYQIPEEGK